MSYKWIAPVLLLILLLPCPVRAADPQAIRIGATVSETGKFAVEVGPFRKLFEAWAETVNAGGGIFLKEYGKSLPLQITVYDDRSEEATARLSYDRLTVRDHVHLLFGPYSSPLTLASSVAAQARKTPFIAVCANSPRIYDRGNRWLVGVIDKAPRYTYRYWDMVKAKGGVNTVAFVVEDTLHPQGVCQGASELALQAGLREVSKEVFPADTQDFTPALAELRKTDPDIIFVSANIPFSVAFMKQALEFGLSPREWHVIHHSGVFRDALGPGAENITGQTYWTPEMRTPKTQEWLKLLKNAEVDQDLYPWAPAYLAAFHVAEEALIRAGTLDPQKLMDTLHALKTDTALGTVAFNEDGSGTINTYPSQIQQGKYVILWPPEAATGSRVFPLPHASR